METVTVVFTNGNVVSFNATEFDVSLTENRNYLNKYPYKNAQGEDSFIYLEPSDVSGVFITKAPSRNDPPVRYSVAKS